MYNVYNIYIYKVFPTGGNPTPPDKGVLIPNPVAVFIAPVPILFNFSYSFETQVMLILILIDVQYSQNAVFSFEKFSIWQNHSCSGSHHLVKNSPSSVHYFLTQSQGNS